MHFTYGQHAAEMLVIRAIERAWVERTVREPESAEPDPAHPERMRAYRRVPERDGRILRVVYIPGTAACHVVTAFLDRGRRRGT